MKRFVSGIALLLFCFLAVSFTDKEGVCTKYKNAKFLVRGRIGEEVLSFTCIRKGAIQTEENNETHAISKLSVKWIRECTFEMRFISTTRKQSAEELAYRKRRPVLTIQITGGSDKYYLYTLTNNLYKDSRSDTAWIIK